MKNLFHKNSATVIGAISIALLILILSAADYISFRGLQSNLLGDVVRERVFEGRGPTGQIDITLTIPEVRVQPDNSFAFPITITPREGSEITGIAANVNFGDNLIPAHYDSNVLEDQGSILEGQEEIIVATMEPTDEETILLAINGTATESDIINISASFSVNYKTITIKDMDIHIEVSTDATPTEEPQDDLPADAPPIANAGGTLDAEPGEEITLNGSSSRGQGLEYAWITEGEDAEDAIYTLSPTKKVTFQEVGTHTYTLLVKNNFGSDEDTVIINVNRAGNRIPVLRLEVPQRIRVGETALIDASQSYDPDGEIDTFTFQGPNITQDTGGTRAIFNPTDPGVFTFIITATDQEGGSAAIQKSIEVLNFGDCKLIDITGPNGKKDKKCDIWDLDWYFKAFQ